MKRQPKALLFDMDGVLVDSMDSWYHALKGIFDRELNRDLDREAFGEKYWGRDLQSIFQEIGLALNIGDFCTHVYNQHTDAIKIFPDTKDCLASLKGYKKAVITNTPQECTHQILTKFSIDSYFDTVLTSDEVAKAKPDPAIALKACDALRVQPGEAWLIGDHRFDMQAGRAAGCTTVGIGVEGDYTLDRLSGLSDLLRP